MPLKGVKHVKAKTSSSFSLSFKLFSRKLYHVAPPILNTLMMPNLNMALSAFGGSES